MRVKVPMGAALVAGSVLIAFLFPMSIGEYGSALAGGIFSQQAIFLAFIVGGLLVFSGALNESGQIDRIKDAFLAIVGRSRLTLVTLPALIGLLPMPGGAIFSAPMVEAAVKDTHLSPTQKTASNYWFRHIWEYWFPLYPGVILAVGLSGVPAAKYILLMIPMTLISLGAGYVVLLHTIRFENDQPRSWSRKSVGLFFRELSPIFVVVIAVIALAPVGQYLSARFAPESNLIKQFGVALGIIGGLGWLVVFRGLSYRAIGKLAIKKSVLIMLFLVLGIVVFQAVFMQSGAVDEINTSFAESGVPMVVVISLVPFVCGLVLGIAVGFVGSSYPIVVGLLSGMTMGEALPYFCLAYIMGYMGMMLSPVHLCLVITNQYFKANLAKAYLYLVPLALFSGLCGTGLFFLYRAIM
ncbi:MAG: DUF401 family protein [Candidatus Sumerlaeia bacterium]